MADRSVSANSWAWIDALLVDACLIPRTIRVDRTLWVAPSSERRSLEVWQAFANGVPSRRSANRVQPTWGRIARITWRRWFLFSQALLKRVSNHSLATGTRRSVINDATFGVVAAHSRARILAPVLNTGRISGTFRVCHTLRSTRGVRIAKVVLEAFADCATVHRTTTSVRATR